jgi:serine/threonine-protein kinase
MSPEQLTRKPVDRRVDVFAASIILWETLTGVRLFQGDDHGEIVARVLNDELVPPSRVVSGIPPGLDEVVMKGLSRDASARYSTAKEMAQAIEALGGLARPAEIGAFVEKVATAVLERRAARIAEIESMATVADDSPMVVEAPPLAEATQQLREPETTNNTDLSSSAPMPDKHPKKRRTGLWIGAGVAALAALGITIVSVSVGRHNDGAQATPAPCATPPAPSVTATAAASTIAIAIASAAPPPTGSARESASAQPTPRKSAPIAPHATTTTTTKPSCSPPFYFDKDGTKRFKTECI